MASHPTLPNNTLPEGSRQQGPPNDAWDDEPSESIWEDIVASGPNPSGLPASGANTTHNDIPASLRPGGGAVRVPDEEDNVWEEARRQPSEVLQVSQGSQVHQSTKLDQAPDFLRPGGNRSETNPFLRNKQTGPALQQSQPQSASSANLSNAFSSLDINEQSTNPWRPAVDPYGTQGNIPAPPSHAPPPPPPPATQPSLQDEVDNDPWARSPAELPANPINASKSPALMSLGSEEGSAWSETPSAVASNAPTVHSAAPISDVLIDEQHIWDDLGMLDKGKEKDMTAPAEDDDQADDWNMIDSDDESNPPEKDEAAVAKDSNNGKQKTGDLLGLGADQTLTRDSDYKTAEVDKGPSEGPALKPSSGEAAEANEEDRPPLPPRNVGGEQRWVPSREPVDGKNESYLIKNIRWQDASSPNSSPRTSPILIQNANGPCPLVALVNALSLTTPSDTDEAPLVNTLRSREQVSLTLLLDAVFDELMSSRRTNSEDALPDVGDLYGFLQSLHTGMNVNPRFVPTEQMVNAYKRTSLTHLHPTERGALIPGTFENTMEMSLYATFSIPLIHGWLPSHQDTVYESLKRQAASYEDVQNLLFREEELEEKLSNASTGLTEDEQELYQDIITIKMFLNASATQLTPWGIEVIGKAIRPGTFAILFRNDHFSTLYCHPQTMQLLTLVTDAGYRTHDEIIWESLVDVNGERTEFLSGDFRLVGSGSEAGPSNLNSGPSSSGQGPWTTVQNSRGKAKQVNEPEPPMSPSREQEDRDLALALQLQEEEEQRQREDEARRRQESQLSEQFIEQQAQQPTPVTLAGRGGAQGGARGGIRGGGGARGGAPIGRGGAPIGRGGAQAGRGGLTTTNQASRSSNSVNIPVTTSALGPQLQNQGLRRSSNTGAPTIALVQQEVRPLVPPRRPGVTRRQSASDEPPPPTYEEAAHGPRYMPPPGHPSHETSSQETLRQTSRVSVNTGTGVGAPGLARPPPGYGLGGSGGRDRDRECVVM